jgi:hypothetical protein
MEKVLQHLRQRLEQAQLEKQELQSQVATLQGVVHKYVPRLE